MKKDSAKRAAKKAVVEYIEEHIRIERQSHSYTIQKPVNLTREFLEANCPEDVDRELWKASTYFIVNSIISQQQKKQFLTGSSLFVPLYTRMLHNVIGRQYKIILDHLVVLKVIVSDDNYIKGTKSRGYKLTNEYRFERYVFRQVTCNQIVDGIRRRNIARLVKQEEKLLPLAHLVRWSIDKKLQIDKNGALEYLEDEYKRMLKREIKKRNLKHQYKNVDAIINNRYEFAVNQVMNLDNQSLNVDSAGGRLYTNITNLMSPLRNFLTYDGEELVNIDLKNSQPLHFLLVRERKFWKSDGPLQDITLKNLDAELYEYIQQQTGTSSLYMMFSRLSETLRSQGFQDPYKRVVEAGKLYEFNSLKFRGELVVDGIDRWDTRSKAKLEFLKLMYYDDKNRYSPSQQSFKLFSTQFPLEAELMRILKSRDYTDFSVLLQKIEARILLHIVCKEVFNQDHTIPLFTVHDSLITSKKHKDTVLNIMERVYERMFGFIPKVETDEMNPLKAYDSTRNYVRDKVDQARIDIIEEIELIKDTRVRKLKHPKPSLEAVISAVISDNKDNKQIQIDEDTLAMLGIINPFEFDRPEDTDC